MIDPTTRPDFQRLSPEEQAAILEAAAFFEANRQAMLNTLRYLGEYANFFKSMLDTENDKRRAEVTELERIAEL